MPSAPPLKSHRQAAPAWGQVWSMLRPLVDETQASKAEHRGLPKSAESSDMNAASRVPHVVRQVDLRCLPEIALRPRRIAKASRHERMNCRAQRAAMPAAWLVILEIRLADLRGQPLPEEMYQHHHIRLFDNLGPLNALPTEQHVHRRSPRRERGKINIFQPEIASELLEQAGLLVEPSVEFASHLEPSARLLGFETEPTRERAPLLRPPLRTEPRNLLPDLQVPLRQTISVRIVVYRLVVFVGSNDSTNMVAAIVFALSATRPEPCGLDQNLGARIDEEALVASGFPVLPHAKGDVCADVMLLLSREDPHDLAVGRDDKRGRHLFAGIGRLPCVEGAAIPKPSGLGSRSRERVVAVHDKRPRRLGISEYKERQHEYVGVPKHMPLVRSSAQSAGANGHPFVLRVCRTRQMINGEAQRALSRSIALDPKVRRFPSCQPGITMLSDDIIHILDCALDLPARHFARLARVPGGVHGDHPIEPVCFAQSDFEAWLANNLLGRTHPTAGGIHDLACDRHGDGRAATQIGR